MMNRIWLSGCLLFLLLWGNTLLAQEKDSAVTVHPATGSDSLSLVRPQSHKAGPARFILEGTIHDMTTGEALPFVTLVFQGTQVGSKTDVDGHFRFELDRCPSDSIRITEIGYARQVISVNKKLSYQFLKIEMDRASVQMHDFVMKVSRDPALALVRKVIAHKPQNDYDKAENYAYELYNKMEFDINKLPRKTFTVVPVLKKFDFVQKFMDSTSDEKPFLPMFLSETISDYYYQRRPKKTKEYIKGTKISGYKNASVSKLMGGMYQNINVYQNNLLVFNVAFVSPVANDAPFFYKYQLTDTQVINGKTCYHVAFAPKRKGEHTFNGDMWIHDTDYAIQRVNMIVTKEENINWVNRVTMYQEFSCLEDTLWFLTKDKFFVDFLPPHGDKIAGFLGKKTTLYQHIVVNDSSVSAKLNDKKNRDDLAVDPHAQERNEAYWKEMRPDTLSKNEKSIYQMIDTIQHLPFYNRYYTLAYLLATGIKKAGPFELGYIYNLYTTNTIEGRRVRYTMGTTPKLFKNIYLQSYAAYGFQDKRFKYYGSALWLLHRNPRMYVYGEYKHDLDYSVNQYDDAGSYDNVFSAIGRKPNLPWKMAFVDKARLEFFKRYFNGFSFHLSAERKVFTPYDPLPSAGIFLNSDGTQSHSVTNNEFGVEVRFAYKERFLEGNYYQVSLGTRYPKFSLYAGQGIKNFLGGNYAFTKLRFTVHDYFKIHHAGIMYYNVFAGKVFGTLPYSLLEVHPGNEFYYYDAHTFNMMNRYEYLSDVYAGAMIEHSLGTLFFKYIPYVNKAKVRGFWNAKGLYGGLSQANRELNLNHGYLFKTLANSPYVELGTGMENILKVLRVDCVWRVLPSSGQALYKRFGLFGSMKFDF